MLVTFKKDCVVKLFDENDFMSGEFVFKAGYSYQAKQLKKAIKIFDHDRKVKVVLIGSKKIKEYLEVE